MANKKIFSIQINGLDESVRSVDALTEKIQNLQKLINSMKGKGVEIPLEVGGENIVKELKAISNKVKSATKGALPLDGEKEYLNLLNNKSISKSPRVLLRLIEAAHYPNSCHNFND